MRKFEFMQKRSLVKKMKMLILFLAFFLIVDLVLILAFRLWIGMAYRDGVVTFVPLSPYRVVIKGEPTVSGNIYWLGRGRHLLMLTPKSSKYKREAYYIRMPISPMIGLPDLPNIRYVPLLRGALVERYVFDGVPQCGKLKADWKVNDNEVRIRIKGFSDAAQKFDNSLTSEAAERMMPVAYQREIILKQTSLDRFVTNLSK